MEGKTNTGVDVILELCRTEDAEEMLINSKRLSELLLLAGGIKKEEKHGHNFFDSRCTCLTNRVIQRHFFGAISVL